MTFEQHLEIQVGAARAEPSQKREGLGGRLEVMERPAAFGSTDFPVWQKHEQQEKGREGGCVVCLYICVC